ncbi:Virginiamycin A acetyltransferase [Phaeobacter sp. CECT 5382]|uniref:CatB-related O-acetyltransferase n=1 Tax=Phaeobacter sp. CECT 5382 TaxID=1712645 RepID=UPI0006DA6708|nr:CatB-related O-acetyltransferase [Phaeobacter sp. CECT 5382]CUH88424.1 Virginiamycin A acetyltransferase [Phaeobacter sp. CECT 5382]
MTSPASFKEGPLGNGKINIGRFTYGYETIDTQHFGDGANLSIGSFSSLASGLKVVLGGGHRVDWITTFPFGHVFQEELGGEEIQGHPQSNGDVVIGNDVWIGQDVTILSGVTIGDGAVIAATSTVTKDVGPYEIWGGNPATFLRSRFDEDTVAGLLQLEWWNLPEKLIKEMAPLLSMPPNEGLLEGLRSIVTDLVDVDGEDAA